MTFEVSVIMPVYNAKGFLQKSIQSALDQEEVKELLVIDDGSTDGSYELLQSWNKQEERMQVFTHANRENLGPGPSRNVGIIHANCEYISFLDADDYYLKSRFIETGKLFSNNHEIYAVYEPVTYVPLEDNYKDYYKGNVPCINGVYYLSFNETSSNYSPIERWWLDGGLYAICGLTVKKRIFQIIGLLDESLYQVEDTDLHYRIALSGLNIIFVTDHRISKTHRIIHGDNISLNTSSKEESLKKLHDKYVGLINSRISFRTKMKVFKKYLLTRGTYKNLNKIERYLSYIHHTTSYFIHNPRSIYYLFRC